MDLLQPQHQLQLHRQLLLHLPAHHLARVTMCAFSVSATTSLATARWTRTLASSSAQSLSSMLWWSEHPNLVMNLKNGRAASHGPFCLKFLFLFIIAASLAMFLDCGVSCMRYVSFARLMRCKYGRISALPSHLFDLSAQVPVQAWLL